MVHHGPTLVCEIDTYLLTIGGSVNLVLGDVQRKASPNIRLIQEKNPDGTQGERLDLGPVRDAIEAGASMEELILNADFDTVLCKYHSWAARLQFAFCKKNAQKFRFMNVKVYHGVTDQGKTRKATEDNAGDFYLLSKDTQSIWFDGYAKERVLIWDDFHWDDVKLQYLLRLLDGYPLKLPVKGGFAWAMYDKVIITTNLPSDLWYPIADDRHRAALARRINEEVEFK